MAYLTEDVGPNRGSASPTWFVTVRDATDPSLSISFSGSHAVESGHVAHEAVFQALVSAIDADPNLVLASASRSWGGSQDVTP